MKFKIKNRSLDALSSVYEAEFVKDVFVRVYKCAYGKVWKAQLIDRIGHSMDINGDLSYFAPTMNSIIKMLKEDVEDKTFCSRLQTLSNESADEHNEWRVSNGQEPEEDYKL